MNLLVIWLNTVAADEMAINCSTFRLPYYYEAKLDRETRYRELMYASYVTLYSAA